MRRATPLLGLSLTLASFAVAQPSTEDFGAPAVDAPPEVKRIDFLRGEWEVTMKARDEKGVVTELPNKPIIRGRFLADALTFQTEFLMAGGADFFSTQVKAYHMSKERWINTFTNARRQRWTTTESYWEGDDFITLADGGYSSDEDFIAKEVDTEIKSSSWRKKLYPSYDGGETWEEQPLFFEVRRLQ